MTAPLIGFNGRLFETVWRPVAEEIDFAAAAGFTALQFQARHPDWQARELKRPLPEIGDHFQAAGVTPTLEINVQLDRHGYSPYHNRPLDVLRANLPFIDTVGINHVHWHLVLLEDLPATEIAAFEVGLYPQFSEAVALAKTHGFQFSFEQNAASGRLFAGPAACGQLLKAVPDLGFVWDINHSTLAELSAFQSLAERMSLLHVSDTHLPETNDHLPLGQGNIKFKSTLAPIFAAGFKGPLILEIGGLPKSGGYGQDTDVALRDSQQRLNDLIAMWAGS